jgi:lipopolysaccharide/colanic/teichoic acid biosynthesis glycosyltransferase
MYPIAKRLFDLAVAIVGLLLLSPLLLAVAICVRWKLGGPVLFQQERPGLDGALFSLYKFRTMLDRRGSDGKPLPDEERLTPFGAFLRKTSLDELPELWNVVNGDMSLVGPRPLLSEYLDYYSQEQHRRHEVRPGLTGWAQFNGRNTVEWDERLAMDVWYVDNRTFLLDLKILWRTLLVVIRSDGINQDGQVTMTKFRGSGK